MMEKRTVYVCVDSRHPVKATCDGLRNWKPGDRFEFDGGMVEVIDVQRNPSGLQLEVTKV